MQRLLSILKRPPELFGGLAAVWLICLVSWMANARWPAAFFGVGLLLPLPPATAALVRTLRRPDRNPIALSAWATLNYVLWWAFLVFAADALVLDALRVHLARIGTGGLFFIGLAWVVWGLERASQFHERRRIERRAARQAEVGVWQALPAPAAAAGGDRRIWNPLDPNAWYYGRQSRKLNQSLAGLSAYSLVFLLAFLVLTQIGGCQEIYEMPAGGGQQQTIAQTIKVQKVIKKKFVVNPFSAISFKVPPIDEIKLQLTEITQHAYTVGYGQGTGAGFAGGTKRGKVRFIRLEYSGGDWDQDFGIGADLNMLIEYGARTQHAVAERTQSRRVAELKNFPPDKSPPFVFMTGQRSISLSNPEIKILREYLLEKHGLLFCDNGGSGHFHNQFFSLMNRVLPEVRPVTVPLDDVIHRVPYQIPFLPYVAPHGGKEAWGWKVDGRWVCYYHPGDIGDAWADEHSGVKPEIWEACYQLGTNVIFYAHAEYSKWLEARQQAK